MNATPWAGVLGFMQDGPAITTNDLPSVEWLTRLLSDESQFAADSPLRGMVIQMCAMLPVDPEFF